MRSGRRNVMNHIASRGTVFGRRGAGNYFSMSHTATRGSSSPYMDFKFCDVRSRGGAMSLYGIWAVFDHTRGRRNAAGFLGD
jgi:hypothetical protein